MFKIAISDNKNERKIIHQNEIESFADNSKQYKDRINSLKNSTLKNNYLKEDESTLPCGEVIKDSKLKENQSKYCDDEKDTCEVSDSDSITEIKTRNIVHSRIVKYESSNKEKSIRVGMDYSQVIDLQCNNSNNSSRERVGSHFVENKSPNEVIDRRCESNKKSNDLEQNYGHNLNSNVIASNKNVLKLLSKRHLANLNIKIDRNKDDMKIKLKDNKWRDSMGSFRATKTGVRTSFMATKKRRRNMNKNRDELRLDSQNEKGATDSNTKEYHYVRADLVHDVDYIEKEIQIGKSDAMDIRTQRDPQHEKFYSRKLSHGDQATSRSTSSSPIEKGPVAKKICSSGSKQKRISIKSGNGVLLNKSDSFKEKKVTRKPSIKANFKISRENLNRDCNSQIENVKLKKINSRCSSKSEYRVSVTIRPNSVADLSNKFNSIISQNKSNSVIKPDCPGTEYKCKSIILPKFYISPKASFKRKYRHKAPKSTNGHRSTAGHESAMLDDTLSEGHYSSYPLRSLSNSLAELNMKDLFEEGDYNKTDEEKVCEKIKTALLSGMFKGETEESEDELQKTEENTIQGHSSSEVVIIKREEVVNKDKLCGAGNITENDVNTVLRKAEPIIKMHESSDNSAIECLENSKLTSVTSISYSPNGENQCNMQNDKVLLEEDFNIQINVYSDINGSCGRQEPSKNETSLVEDLSNDFASIDTTKSNDSGIHSISTLSHMSGLSDSNTSVVSKNIPIHVESANQSVGTIFECENSLTDASNKNPSSSSQLEKPEKLETNIYASILSAVKNTMKKTAKEKDVRITKEDKIPKEKKWFKRSKSKERKTLLSAPVINELCIENVVDRDETIAPEAVSCEVQHMNEQITLNSINSAILSPSPNSKKQSRSIKKTKEAFYGRFLFGSKSKDKSAQPTESSAKEMYTASTKLEAKTDLAGSSIQQSELEYAASSVENISQTDSVLSVKTNNQSLSSEMSNQYSKLKRDTKTIPPPPKTPIPSPPPGFKNHHIATQNRSDDVPRAQDNSCVIKRKADHRLNTDGLTIHPNASFLWSSAMTSPDIRNNFMDQCNDYSQINENNEYFQEIKPHSKMNKFAESTDESVVPNYTEIKNLSDEDQELITYEGFRAASVLSYDEIKAPYSCSYDDVLCPSGNDSSLTFPEGYDPICPPADGQQYDYVGTVTAKLAVVNENQIDSLSYEYDDIAAYNVSLMSHSYEPVCPPDDFNMIHHTAVPFQQSTQKILETSEVPEFESEEGSGDIHEVFSYEITSLGKSTVVKQRNVKSSQQRSQTKKDKKSRKSNYKIKAIMKNPSEWIDINNLEEPPALSIQFPIAHLQKRRNRCTADRVAWTQGVRRYVRSHPQPSSPKKRGRKGRDSTPRTMNCRADTDNDDEAGGDYEAIYEVINPAERVEVGPDDSLVDDIYCPDDDIDLNDSFDSDDSSEAYCRLEPLSTLCPDSRCLSESSYSETMEKQPDKKYNRSTSNPQYNMTKIAEAANSGMKRLRRNWSYTKHEVKTGLSKIKKKSTFSASDVKSSENIYEETSPAASDKSKWSFKSHFRQKLSTSSSQSDIFKESKSLSSKKTRPTFYLTLTIAPDSQEDLSATQNYEDLLNHRKISAPSLTSSTLNINSNPTDSVIKSKSMSNVPKRTVSARSMTGVLSRPTTAPPAPPAENCNEENEDSQEISKDKLAMKLNQILSSGPTAPPGRRVLRSSDSPCLDYCSPSFDYVHNNKSAIKYASISPPIRHSMPLEVFNAVQFNSPGTRSSVISSSSNGSSEGYIRPSDIASSPPPLPARPLSGAGSFKRLSDAKLKTVESRSYLDLNYNTEFEPIYTTSRFQDEPLYQFYTAGVEGAALFQGDSSEDDYEVINDGSLKQDLKLMRPTAMELVTPIDGRRTLWCELPEVTSSGILSKISMQERKTQEAMFEVLTSEASYLKSLNVLVSHFKNCPEFNGDDDTRVISRREAKVLFSDILPVMKCAELFLADLDSRWQESVKISGISDIVLKHSESFTVYVKYCSNQIYQDRMLRKLRENNPRFVDVVSRLESSSICQSLAVHSFLMLPMQRITRLPLLLDAIFNRLEYGSPHWEECKSALAKLTMIVAECNEGARKMERLEEMLILSRQLDFREVKAIPVLSSSRWLVKKGELTRLTWREGDAKLTFGRKISKHTLYFFLFSDLLVVTKRKSDDQHLVLDYCPRNMVQVLELENANRFPGRILDGYKNLLIMTMLQNHENRTIEMVLSCSLESDRTRWIEAVTPRISDNPEEQVYEEWDCPQVQATHSYLSVQPDEISLEIADVINVLKKTSDGWYQGERLRDGEKGWFPGNHTVEIASAHVRARNLRQRYRLLVISGSFIEKEKKEREEKSDKKKERRKTITLRESL